MLLHRIALAEHSATAAEAFSGLGGLFGKGRWHTRGRLIVYAAEHISLAMAESLVHIQRSNDIAPLRHLRIVSSRPHMRAVALRLRLLGNCPQRLRKCLQPRNRYRRSADIRESVGTPVKFRERPIDRA